MARDKIINAGALIAFEKGRSWPHESTRARLESVLQWPAGSIAEIRDGSTSPDEESTRVISTAVATPLIAQTIQLALKSIESAAESLPDPGAADYPARAGAILADLRNLQAVAADAAQNAPGTPRWSSPLARFVATTTSWPPGSPRRRARRWGCGSTPRGAGRA